MMRFAREILALLLVSALLLATGAWAAGDQGLGLSNLLSDHHLSDDYPVGCHVVGGGSLAGSEARQQVPHSPQRAPERHECCLTGHDAAMAVSYSFQPLISAQRIMVPPGVPSKVRSEPEPGARFPGGEEVSIFSSAGPSGITSLRI